MVEPGDREFDELIELAQRAVGPGLLPLQHNRWRELVARLLGTSADARERRTGLRAAARLPLALLEPRALAGLFTSTLSSGGFSLRLPEPPPVGTRLKVQIDTQLRPAPII